MIKINRIDKLCCYLISKGVSNQLKLQKLLFFIRYEEIKSGNTKNSYFDKSNNFEAWIYGPVNRASYKKLQNYFWGLDEKDSYLLDLQEIQEIDKIYGQYFKKWNKLSSSDLVEKSHLNLSWIKARTDIDADKPSNNYLIENEDFINFK